MSIAPTQADAFLITLHGSSSGYHFTDRLTLDGVLEGFAHDDFGSGFALRYRRQVPDDFALGFFMTLESEAVRAAPDYVDGGLEGGLQLRLVIRLRGCERIVWMTNRGHPIWSNLVSQVWKLRPEEWASELPPALRRHE